MIDIPSIIDRAKLALNLQTDSELAKILNIKPSAISMWRHRDSIDLISLLNLCQHVTSDWLIYGKGEITTHKSNRKKRLKILIEILEIFDDNEFSIIEKYIKNIIENKEKEKRLLELENRLSELESKIEVK